MSAADVLNAAADLLQPEGSWCQRRFMKKGARCLASAISQAAGRDCQPFLSRMGFDSLGAATSWNDRHGRTQAEVVQALREAARVAGNGSDRRAGMEALQGRNETQNGPPQPPKED